MKIVHSEIAPSNFNDNSKVWIYQASRLFSFDEALQLQPILDAFVQNWTSHGAKVKGYANLFYGQFIVLMADESATGVSGCSTDSSVAMIKSIESTFNVNLFDRQMLAFYIKDKIQLLPFTQLQYAINNGFIHPDTLYFNNLVHTKKDWMNDWVIPVKESWLNKKLVLPI